MTTLTLAAAPKAKTSKKTQAATPPPPRTPMLTEPDRTVPTTVDRTLAIILSWPRKHATSAELLFREWLIKEIIARAGPDLTPTTMAAGCITLTIPRPDGKKSAVLFSSHMDTVEGFQGTVQTPGGTETNLAEKKRLTYDTNFGTIALDKNSPGGSLGADDGAGIWLKLEMISAKVPGTYLFHTGEEVGGIGSRAMASECKVWLGGFDLAVAFDRAGTGDVITHQRGRERCASEKFALALCVSLDKYGLDYTPCDGGTFTDVYNYRGMIAECINLSVGYESQHGPAETLDYPHLVALRAAVLDLDWDALPVDRTPEERAPYTPPSYGNDSWSRFNGYGERPDFDDADLFGGAKWSAKTPPQKAPTPTKAPVVTSLTGYDELIGTSWEDLEALIVDDPEASLTYLIGLMTEIGRLRADNTMLQSLSGIDLPPQP